MTAPVEISSLYPQIRRYAPGCPDAILLEEIRLAAREFCQRSRWLRQILFMDTVADQNTYTLVPEDASVEVIGIKAMEYDGEPLTPGKPEEHPHETGRPEYFFYHPASEFILMPTPDTSETQILNINMIVQPIITTTTLPDTLTQGHERTLVYGALSRLLMMPGAAWENANLALAYEDRFHNRVEGAKAQADMTHHQKAFRTKTYNH